MLQLKEKLQYSNAVLRVPSKPASRSSSERSMFENCHSFKMNPRLFLIMQISLWRCSGFVEEWGLAPSGQVLQKWYRSLSVVTCGLALVWLEKALPVCGIQPLQNLDCGRRLCRWNYHVRGWPRPEGGFGQTSKHIQLPEAGHQSSHAG